MWPDYREKLKSEATCPNFVPATESLKALAALQGKTIRDYAIERLFPADMNGDQAWQELKAMLGERIADGLAGKVSIKSIGQIVDEELDKQGSGIRRSQRACERSRRQGLGAVRRRQEGGGGDPEGEAAQG